MRRVFIVDDDDLILKSLSRALMRPDLEVVAFSSAEEVMPFLTHPPDLLICDYHLPKLDGLNVASKAKQKNPATKTMLLSGGLEDEAVLAALKSKVLDRFFPKPWHYDELMSTVNGLLGPQSP